LRAVEGFLVANVCDRQREASPVLGTQLQRKKIAVSLTRNQLVRSHLILQLPDSRIRIQGPHSQFSFELSDFVFLLGDLQLRGM
jgi:hypothetical protein